MPGDLNDDQAVDGADAAILFGNWNRSGVGDLDQDGSVDGADAGILFTEWTGDAIFGNAGVYKSVWSFLA